MTMLASLFVPAERRAELHRWAVSLSDYGRGAEMVPGHGPAFDQLAADLDGNGGVTMTAPPAVLWLVLLDGLNEAGGEIHGLTEVWGGPSREAIHAQFAVMDWYLDALDVVGSLEPAREVAGD